MPGRKVVSSAPRPTSRTLLASAVFLTFVAITTWPGMAAASFHLNEVNKIMAGFNGNTNIQAVELRMITSGEHVIGGGVIRTYNAAGGLVGTLGTFPGNLPLAQALPDRKILCATALFQSTFGITADLTIAPGVIPTTGQVSFEVGACLVNAIPYGDVTVFKNGTTAAPQLPTALAYVLVRTVPNGTGVFCPLAENAAARFVLRSGSSAAPVVFSNNANVSVNVFSTMTDADAPPAVPPALRASPNPFRHSVELEFADRSTRVAIHDVSGRLVRSWNTARAPGGAVIQRLSWDGSGADGKPVASGIYFVRIFGAEAPRSAPLRIVLLR